MSISFRSPVTKPLLRHDAPLPADRTSVFRVTQRFGDPDSYWSKTDPAKAALGHRATDIGDFGCGSPIVAMAAGMARRIQDNAASLPNVPPGTTNALGVRTDHGENVVTEVWHLGSWTIPAAGGPVAAGQQIGTVGATGLGAVCHCHITCRLNGVLIDPEPLMFGGSIETGAAGAGEDDIMFNPRDVLALHGIGLLTRAGARVRTRQGLTYPILAELAAGTALTATSRVVGEMANGSIEWYAVWIEVGGEVQLGFVHSSAVDVVAPAASAGITVAELAQAERRAFVVARDRTIAAYGLAGEAAARAVQP